MTWLKRLAGSHSDDIPFTPLAPGCNKNDLHKRVGSLTGDEYEIYKWLREYYSVRWIAETLMLDKRTVKDRIGMICKKLGAHNRAELLRAYRTLECPQKGLVDTGEIDRYIDQRMEQKIKAELRRKQNLT